MQIKGKLILGISGKMGSGKDTVAKNLKNFKVMRFADALKEACCIIFGWKIGQLEDLNFKMTIDPFWGETPRALLQKFGTEACRNGIRKDIWVKVLEQRVRDEGATRIVVTDVRFPNEAQAILDWGGYMMRVNRPGFIPPNLTPDQANHSSETGLDDYQDWTMVITNDKGLDELERDAVQATMQLENMYANRRTSKAS